MGKNVDGSLFDQVKGFIMSFVSTPEELRIPLSGKNMLQGIKYRDLRQNNRYNTNVLTMTCECPGFQKYQHFKYKKDDIRRMCKHLSALYRETTDYSSASEINKAIIENGYDVRGNYQIIKVEDNESGESFKIGILFSRENPWINVYSPDETGKYKEYGFSIETFYWARKDRPVRFWEVIEEYIKANS